MRNAVNHLGSRTNAPIDHFKCWPMTNPGSVASSSRLVVLYRPANDLIPDPRNARTHPKRQIDQLRASIKEFGFTNPILVDPEGHIIAGHGRLQAARAMESPRYRPSSCPAYPIFRSGRFGSPTTRSPSMLAGIWKSFSRNWASSLQSMSILILH